MLTIALACLPIVATWTATLGIAWIRTPARRGALRRRWRDLRGPATREASGAGVVDLSQRSAAYLLALRAGSLVRGVAYLALVACVLLELSLPIAAVVLIGLIWIFGQWQKVANMAFFAATGFPFEGFREAALSYQFPSRRRGSLWTVAESWPATALSIVGLSLILSAGLPLAYGSDTLITPVPGIYIQHSHLSPWALGLILVAAGLALEAMGAWLDRATKRRAMRRETALPRIRAGRLPMLFLRPFGSEELRIPAHQGPRRDGLALLLPRRTEFLEDIVTWLLWSQGEVLAIAAPGRGQLKTVGAAHHPVAGARWTTAALKLMASARAIVLVPGDTPGVCWEYDQVRGDRDLARKTLLVNSEPAAGADPFLTTVGASAAQVQELQRRRLLALAAVLEPDGPKLLCAPLAEDIDFEVAVEWFMCRELPPPQLSGLQTLAALGGRVLDFALHGRR